MKLMWFTDCSEGVGVGVGVGLGVGVGVVDGVGVGVGPVDEELLFPARPTPWQPQIANRTPAIAITISFFEVMALETPA